MSLALPGGPSAPKVPLVTTPSSGNLSALGPRSHLLAQRPNGKAKDSIVRGQSSPLLKVSQESAEKGASNGPQQLADPGPPSSLKVSTDSATDHGLHDLDAFWKNQADAISHIGRSGSLQIFGKAHSRPNLPGSASTFEAPSSSRSGPDSARSEGDSFRTSHKRSHSDISRLTTLEGRQQPVFGFPTEIHRFGAEDVVIEVDTASSTSDDQFQLDSRAISPIEVDRRTQTPSPTAASSQLLSSPSAPSQLSPNTSISTSVTTSTTSSPSQEIKSDISSLLSPQEPAVAEPSEISVKPASLDLSCSPSPISTYEASFSSISDSKAAPPSPSKHRSQLSNSPSLPEFASPALSSSPPKSTGFSHRASVHLSGLFDRSGVLDLHSPNPNPTSIRADFSSFLKSGNVDASGSVQDTEVLMPDSDVDYPVPSRSEEPTGLEEEEESPLFDLAEWRRSSASDHITNTINSHGLTISRHMTLKELQEAHGDALQVNLALVAPYDADSSFNPLLARLEDDMTPLAPFDDHNDLEEPDMHQDDDVDSDDSDRDIHSWSSSSAHSTIRISGSVSMEVLTPRPNLLASGSSSSKKGLDTGSRSMQSQLTPLPMSHFGGAFSTLDSLLSPPKGTDRSLNNGLPSFDAPSRPSTSAERTFVGNNPTTTRSHRRRTSSSSSAEERRSTPMASSPPPLTSSSHLPIPRSNVGMNTTSSFSSPQLPHASHRLHGHHHHRHHIREHLQEASSLKGAAAPPPSPNSGFQSSSPFRSHPIPTSLSSFESDSPWIYELSDSVSPSRKSTADRYPTLSTSPTFSAHEQPLNRRPSQLSASTSGLPVHTMPMESVPRPMGSETIKARRRRSSGHSSPQSASSASSMVDIHSQGGHLRPPVLKLVPSPSSERVMDETSASRSSSRQSSLLSPHYADTDSDSSEDNSSPFVRLGKDGKRSMRHLHGSSISDLDALGPAPQIRFPHTPGASSMLHSHFQHPLSPHPHTPSDDIVAVMNSFAVKSAEKDLSRHRRNPSQTKLERRLREVERRLELLEKYQSSSSDTSANGATGSLDGYTSLRTSMVYGPVPGSSPGSIRRGRSNTIATVSHNPGVGSSTHSISSNPIPTASTTAPTATIRTSSTYSPNANAYNRRFQEIMQLSGPIKYIQMSALGRDFVQLAEVYGRIIISERCLPPEQKSIKPVALGGQAGGSKFMVQGILFKYAMDVRLAAAPGREKWLYGGKRRDDGAAIKAASNELLGLSSFVKCNSNNTIRFPLMALIDYCGFRLVAVSTLPINADTIVYGSADAGRSVHNKEESVMRAMQEFGHDLNLREHMVFNTPIMGPGDLEVHRGLDGNLYMIDFARTFPPEAPGEFAHPQSIFYKLLRPELVRGNGRPLSSDAFSGWQSSDSKSGAMNEDVEEATKRLLETVVPAYPKTFLAPDFQAHFRSEVCNISDLHRRGINLRHLGRVRDEMYKVTEDNDSLYLVEMICRTLKSYIAMRFRALMEDLIIFAEEPFRNEALMLFNLVAQPSTAADFWHVRVKSLIQRKYGAIALRTEELDPEVMLLNVLPKEHRLYLVRRLAWHLCVIFDDNIWDNFQEALNSNAEFEFFPQDIKEIKPRIKYMTILDLALGITLYMQAAGAVDASRNEANILLLQEAKICLVNSWTRISDCLVTRYFLAKVWYLMGKLKSDGADDFARALVMIESTMVEERDRADLRLDYAKAGVMAYIYGREPIRFEQALIHYREVTKSHPPLALTLRNDVLAWMSNQHGNKAVDSHQLTNRINATHSVMRLLLTDLKEYEAFCEQLNTITAKPRNWQTPLSRSSFSGRMFTS